MQAEEQITFTQDDFASSNWRETISSADSYGYSSLFQAFIKSSDSYRDSNEISKSQIMRLIAQACSMMIDAKSINEPFTPILQDFQAGRRSAIPDDFTVAELAFFESILEHIDEPMLRGRLADLLWLCRKPKDPLHARIAIEAYTSHPIKIDTWRMDIDKCYERASRICLQIKEYTKLEAIEERLYSAFQVDYPESPFMPLWLSQLLDRLSLGRDKHRDIAQRLYSIAQELQQQCNFDGARSYLDLAAKKYQQGKDEKGWLDSLVLIAECFELEADQRSLGALPSQMVSNSFYENAIQAYRHIPVKHRATYDVENKLRSLREKLSKSGKASLEEMGLIRTPGIDIKDMIEASQAHVSGKQKVEEALMYFTGVSCVSSYESLKKSAEESIAKHLLNSLFGSKYMSADGRVIAKTPSIDLNGEDEQANHVAVMRQILQDFSIKMQLAVEGQILPALRQILMEHRVTRDLLEALCYHSPLVPPMRKKLTATALWFGFEYDFSNAIHLLCPQLEHMVRVKLKDVGAHTSNVDQDGVENENGLSTLLDLPEAEKVFGKDMVFEIRAVFADAIGPNLRNEVAHGLLDDNTASSIGSIYAWWMVLRLIVRSLMGLGVVSNNNAKTEDKTGT
jgi:tetratricopeptide (TPR) repeat protein